MYVWPEAWNDGLIAQLRLSSEPTVQEAGWPSKLGSWLAGKLAGCEAGSWAVRRLGKASQAAR